MKNISFDCRTDVYQLQSMLKEQNNETFKRIDQNLTKLGNLANKYSLSFILGLNDKYINETIKDIELLHSSIIPQANADFIKNIENSQRLSEIKNLNAASIWHKLKNMVN